jgi:hypothetical protein
MPAFFYPLLHESGCRNETHRNCGNPMKLLFAILKP